MPRHQTQHHHLLRLLLLLTSWCAFELSSDGRRRHSAVERKRRQRAARKARDAAQGSRGSREREAEKRAEQEGGDARAVKLNPPRHIPLWSTTMGHNEAMVRLFEEVTKSCAIEAERRGLSTPSTAERDGR